METDAENNVSDSQMMQVDIPEDYSDLWEDDDMETNDLLCQALDEEMERQRQLGM